jgi:hypothetical protein
MAGGEGGREWMYFFLPHPFRWGDDAYSVLFDSYIQSISHNMKVGIHNTIPFFNRTLLYTINNDITS